MDNFFVEWSDILPIFDKKKNPRLRMSFSYSKKSFGWMLLFAFVFGEGRTQQPKFLPLQPHKLQWAQQVLKEAKTKKDSALLAEAYYLFGKTYEAAGDYLTSKHYFMQSLRIQEARGDSYELTRLYMRLSQIECALLHYEETLHYAQLSMAVAHRVGSDRALLQAYGRMAAVHSTDWTAYKGQEKANVPKPNYDSVLYYFKKIEPIARRSPEPMELAAINAQLGSEMLRRNNPKAIYHLEEGLKICVKQQKKAGQVSFMLQLAKAYLTFGQSAKAYQFLTQAQQLQQTLPSNDQFTKTVFEETFHNYYKAIGNWKQAYEHAEKLHAFEKNQFLADREGAVSRLGIEYETEKKEAQLKSQQKELALSNENQTIQRRFLVALSFLLIGAVVAIVVVYRLYRKNQQISRQNATLVREQNHRVKNNLQVVSSLLTLQSNRLTDEIAKSAVEDTQLRIEVMTILQRKLYDGDQLASVRLLEFIAELLEIVLQTFDYEHVKITYDISATLEVSMDHALRIGLIVNELATNACKYAFTDHPYPKFSVTCSVQQGIFEMKVADNGKGFKQPNPSNNTKKMSFGMRLIQIQVEQLYGTYHFDTQNGTVFQMQFKV